jgi:hypothetical protein
MPLYSLPGRGRRPEGALKGRNGTRAFPRSWHDLSPDRCYLCLQNPRPGKGRRKWWSTIRMISVLSWLRTQNTGWRRNVGRGRSRYQSRLEDLHVANWPSRSGALHLFDLMPRSSARFVGHVVLPRGGLHTGTRPTTNRENRKHSVTRGYGNITTAGHGRRQPDGFSKPTKSFGRKLEHS